MGLNVRGQSYQAGLVLGVISASAKLRAEMGNKSQIQTVQGLV